ncbi:MAG: hypothetical protein IIC78_11730 [Chloroflexi bacterium]|nr:hypothetical protein [Chloroflexota bacterium]
MLVDRIIGAFTFRKGVYAEVEHDTTFTAMAWVLVVGAAFLNAFGTGASNEVFSRLIGAGIGTVFTVIAFAVATFIISWIGKSMFGADVTFDEMVRTLGLAYVWNAVGVIGIVSIVSTTLSCVTAPFTFAAALAGLVAWFVATKEALDLAWGQTIVTVIVGWVVMLVISLFVGFLLSALGLGAAVLSGL